MTFRPPDWLPGAIAAQDAYQGDFPPMTPVPAKSFEDYLREATDRPVPPPPQNDTLPLQARAGAAEGLAGYLRHYDDPVARMTGAYDPEERQMQLGALARGSERVPKPTDAPGRYTRSVMGAVANPGNYWGVSPGAGLLWAGATGVMGETAAHPFEGTRAEPYARAAGAFMPMAIERAVMVPQSREALLAAGRAAGSAAMKGGKALGETFEDLYQALPQGVGMGGLTRGTVIPQRQGGETSGAMGGLAEPAAYMRAVKYQGGVPSVREEPFHGFTEIRSTSKPQAEMDYVVSNVPDLALPRIKPEDLLDKEIIFTAGDRTRAGGTLTRVGGRRLETPVPQEGGPYYGALHEGDPGTPEGLQKVWANAPPPATGLINIGKDIIARGREPVLMYQAMGKQAMDSSKQMALPALELARSGKVSRAGGEFVNARMADVEGWPGWRSKNLEEWLTQTTGTNRGKFVKAMDMREAHDLGLPNLGELRYAQTVPRLRSTPTGSVGLTIAKFNPEAGTVPSGHSTYERGLLGQDVSTFGGSVPWHIAAPDPHAGLLAAGRPVKFAERPDYYMAGRIPEGVPKTQVVDRQWVDTVSEWMRKNPQLWAAAGAIPMGALAAQDNPRQQ